MSIEDTINSRHHTHGNFIENARLSQVLKGWFVQQPGYTNLTYVQREALDMIALKLARILSGHSQFADHWHDLAGYATLAESEILNEPPPQQEPAETDFNAEMQQLMEQRRQERESKSVPARRPGKIHAVESSNATH